MTPTPDDRKAAEQLLAENLQMRDALVKFGKDGGTLGELLDAINTPYTRTKWSEWQEERKAYRALIEELRKVVGLKSESAEGLDFARAYTIRDDLEAEALARSVLEKYKDE